MTDRELLELAAKAAGRTVGRDDQCDPIGRKFDHSLGLWCAGPWAGWFNPLRDSGEALRLAVKLRIAVGHDEFGKGDGHYAEWVHPKLDAECQFVEHENKQGDFSYDAANSATCRVIVRAAAEIGTTTTKG